MRSDLTPDPSRRSSFYDAGKGNVLSYFRNLSASPPTKKSKITSENTKPQDENKEDSKEAQAPPPGSREAQLLAFQQRKQSQGGRLSVPMNHQQANPMIRKKKTMIKSTPRRSNLPSAQERQKIKLSIKETNNIPEKKKNEEASIVPQEMKKKPEVIRVQETDSSSKDTMAIKQELVHYIDELIESEKRNKELVEKSNALEIQCTSLTKAVSEHDEQDKANKERHMKREEHWSMNMENMKIQLRSENEELKQSFNTLTSIQEDTIKAKEVYEKYSNDLSTELKNEIVLREKVEKTLKEVNDNIALKVCHEVEWKECKEKCIALEEDLSLRVEQIAQMTKKAEEVKTSTDAEIRVLQASLQQGEEISKGQEYRLTLQESQVTKILATHDEAMMKIERECDALKARLKEMDQHIENDTTMNQELHSTIEQLHINMELQASESNKEMESMQQEHNTILERMTLQYDINENIRRILHNKVMELKGNIRVFCRVRPLIGKEKQVATSENPVFSFPSTCEDATLLEISASNKDHISYLTSTAAPKKWSFQYDRVFGPHIGQEDFFVEVSALIQSAMDGYRVCIFAYGQTGSGKTHTMQGDPTNPSEMGVIPRAVATIFDVASEREINGWKYELEIQGVEIYNESFLDLLVGVEKSSKKRKVELKLDENGFPQLVNVLTIRVKSAQDVMSILQTAMSKRQTKSTLCNDRSSRSHCVFTLLVKGVNARTNEYRSGVINLIDLAGSERLAKSGSGSDPVKLKEAQAINKSLSCLGNVIGALAKKDRHVPFRDSKLTFLLQPSLGGDCKTLMICNLSPHPVHRTESLNSLRFAKMVNSCELPGVGRVQSLSSSS